MYTDPIVEQVRNARQRHSAQFGHNLEAIIADLKEKQRHMDRPVVTLSPKRPVRKAS